MPNKRFMPRQRRRLRINLGGRLPAMTADVSPGGFSVEMAHAPRVGATVAGSISIAEHSYDFTGQVSWVLAGDPRLSLRARVGVRFTGVAPEFFAHYQTAFER